MSKRKQKQAKPRPAKASLAKEKQPLIEHIHELRRRLFYVAACVAMGSAIAYGFEHALIAILLRPSHGQQFIYTSPIGGINFLFSVCLDIGLVLATPVILYQLLAFLQPIMKNTTHRFLIVASALAGVVAFGGVLFGYFIGLPSALHFLLHQFTTIQVKPLITIQSYMQFVALYLFGSALMFQLPLILIIVNRIKPLKPSKLLKYERQLIVGAFIVAFIMNPTPNIIDQLSVVVPIIAMYQVGIALIWSVNRGKKPDHIALLREQDAIAQAERASRVLSPLTFAEELSVAAEPAPLSELELQPVSLPSETAAQTPINRPQNYATEYAQTPRRYRSLPGQLVQ